MTITPLTKEEAIKLKSKDLSEFNKFLSNHFYASKDDLTKVLKAHLYVEYLIDQILTSSFPNPSKLLRTKFSYKIDLLEAIGSEFYMKIIEPLRTLNNIRNKYSHNLNYQPTKYDIYELCKIVELKKERTLNAGLFSIISYLHALKTVTISLPYLTACLRGKILFEKDKGFDIKKINESYKDEAKVFLESLKI